MNIDERTGKPKIILHLCADMGSDSLPYKYNGYDVRCIGKDIGVENFIPPKNVYGIIANPPCTMFSIARTKAKISRNLEEGMRLVKECLRVIWTCQYRIYSENPRHSHLKFWCIENPASGFLKWFLGKATYEYSPHEYGAPFTKQTALWGQFNVPDKVIIKNQAITIEDSFRGGMLYMGNQRINKTIEKSNCWIGFARAFYEANR